MGCQGLSQADFSLILCDMRCAIVRLYERWLGLSEDTGSTYECDIVSDLQFSAQNNKNEINFKLLGFTEPIIYSTWFSAFNILSGNAYCTVITKQSNTGMA